MSVTPQSLEVVDIDTKDLDNAKHVETTSQGITRSPEEEKALVKKIDTYMFPTIWFIIGNAKIAGMVNDLRLTSSQYSIALVVFFVTYVFFEALSNMLIAHIKPSLLLTRHHDCLGRVDLCYGCHPRLQTSRLSAHIRWCL